MSLNKYIAVSVLRKSYSVHWSELSTQLSYQFQITDLGACVWTCHSLLFRVGIVRNTDAFRRRLGQFLEQGQQQSFVKILFSGTVVITLFFAISPWCSTDLHSRSFWWLSQLRMARRVSRRQSWTNVKCRAKLPRESYFVIHPHSRRYLFQKKKLIRLMWVLCMASRIFCPDPRRRRLESWSKMAAIPRVRRMSETWFGNSFKADLPTGEGKSLGRNPNQMMTSPRFPQSPRRPQKSSPQMPQKLILRNVIFKSVASIWTICLPR